MLKDLDRILERIYRHWHKPAALAVALALVLAAYIWVAGAIRSQRLTQNDVAPLLALITILVGIWLHARRVPTTPRGKVGFVFALKHGPDVDKQHLKEDFIDTLRRLVRSGPLGQGFCFLDLKRHHANQIEDLEDAQRFRLKCRAHFVLYGTVRSRELDGKRYHILRLSGLVIHSPTTPINQRNLQQEFSELLPQAIDIAQEKDFLRFEVTSQVIDITARYIIGIAAAITGDLSYAESMYRDLHSRLASAPRSETELKIRQRLPRRLSEICMARANSAYSSWVKTGTSASIVDLERALESIPPQERDSYGAKLLRACLYFLLDRATPRARREVMRCSRERDSAWRFSLAFLEAHDGRVARALKLYKKIESLYCSPSLVTGVEAFMLRVLDEDQSRYQFCFLLGYLNWKLKGDQVVAQTFFTEFVQRSADGSFPNEVRLAQQYLRAMASGQK